MYQALDEGWVELLDPLLDMEFRTYAAGQFLQALAALPAAGVEVERELVRRLWTIPLLLDRIGMQLGKEHPEVYRDKFVPWEQHVFVELARILGEPYDLSKR